MTDRYQQLPRDEEWVVLRNCVWLQEAVVLRSVLESGGIDALIPDEHFVGANSQYGVAVGGVRLMVRSSDLEQACALLEEMSDSKGTDADDE